LDLKFTPWAGVKGLIVLEENDPLPILTSRLQEWIDWLSRHSDWLTVFAALGAVAALASLIIIPMVIILLPNDYFTRYRESAITRVGSPLHLMGMIIKNLFGILFVLSGFVMLFLPGQGILTMLFGLSLVDFPAKHRVVLRILRYPKVLRMITWLRSKANRPQLEIPENAG